MVCAFNSAFGAAASTRAWRGVAAFVAPVASSSAFSAAKRSCPAEAIA